MNGVLKRKKRRVCSMFKIFSNVYLLNKYIKCNIWRLAVGYDIYIYIYICH